MTLTLVTVVTISYWVPLGSLNLRNATRKVDGADSTIFLKNLGSQFWHLLGFDHVFFLMLSDADVTLLTYCFLKTTWLLCQEYMFPCAWH